jgi:vacuolar-type H+-ATPase subunit D/Vma8
MPRKVQKSKSINLKFLLVSAQMLMKARLAGAHKGHGLLKKKADALQMRFRMILSKIIEVCGKVL